MSEAMDRIAELRAEIERLRQEAANYKHALFSNDAVHKQHLANAKEEIERLHRWHYLISHWPDESELKEMARAAMRGEPVPEPTLEQNP